MDAVFSRDLFTYISWAGGSKSDTPKTALKNFKRTIDFFISLIRQIFPDFSENSCFDFFKNKVIANSKARAKALQQRVSRTKHRIKNKIGDVHTVDDNDENAATFNHPAKKRKNNHDLSSSYNASEHENSEVN